MHVRIRARHQSKLTVVRPAGMAKVKLHAVKLVVTAEILQVFGITASRGIRIAGVELDSERKFLRGADEVPYQVVLETGEFVRVEILPSLGIQPTRFAVGN